MTLSQPAGCPRLFIFLCVLAGLSLLLTVGLTARYLLSRQDAEREALLNARLQVEGAGTFINAEFAEVMRTAQQLADDLTSGIQPYTTIEGRLRVEMNANRDVFGLAITFAPFVYDPELRLYQMYISRDALGQYSILDGATYDYTRPQDGDPTLPNTDWYLAPIERGAMWNEPFYATGAQRVLVEYGVPFFREHPQTSEWEPAGVVTIDYSLQDTRELLARLELGATGYAFLLSGEGIFLAHPIGELVARSTLEEFATAQGDAALRDIAVNALMSEDAIFTETRDLLTGDDVWVFIERIPATGWALGVVIQKSEFLATPTTTLREQTAILLSGALFVTLFSAAALRVDRGEASRLWVQSILTAVVCVSAILVIWNLSAAFRPVTGTRITDNTALNRYLERHFQSSELNTAIYTVPTGIQLLSVQFPDSISAVINGYIWQRYDETIPDEIVRGIALPQTSGEEIILDEVLEEEVDGGEIYVWYFGLKVIQDFDPTRFPFDHRSIAIRLAPADLRGRVLLTPDINGYGLFTPGALPGIDSQLLINSWGLSNSSFSYRPVAFNTNFGFNERLPRTETPELFFTLNIQRESLGPFIAYVLPAAIIAFLMFAYLVSDRPARQDIEIVTNLSYAAALFFVVAVSHNALRETIAAVGLTYLDYLFILLYVTILVVSVNFILIIKRPQLPIIRYRGNLIPELLYWPVFTGALLLVTVFIFVLN